MGISSDALIYDEDLDARCTVKSSNMCQELGLVSNIFSDKTGTLTRNEMKFVKFMIHGDMFDIPQHTHTEEGDVSIDMTTNPMLKTTSLVGPSGKSQTIAVLDGRAEKEFIRCLTVCHTVVREKDGTYRAESPDELALVEGVAPYGCSLLERGTVSMLVNLFGEKKSYDIMAVNAFDSDRKRMSILVKDQSSGECFLFCKGADSIMMELCSLTTAQKEKADKSLYDLACLGLRTLCIAVKRISSGTAAEWARNWKEATASLENRAEKVAAAGAAMELDMELLGITAIEDRLQDEVPEVLAELSKAGITLWMLAGDEEETAVNIGRSCNLLENDTKLFYISGATDHKHFVDMVNAAYFDVSQNLTPGQGYYDRQHPTQKPVEIAIVMDGPSFKYFDEENHIQRGRLLFLGQNCRSVVACRLTPVQKQQLVGLVKNDAVPKAVTLAIGDGANDVSMIREADVGIGIIGKEGRQAANTADFAIGQFKFLKRLMFVHGRWNYIRQSKAFLYCMHKNMVITLTLFVYSFYALVSGQTLYESWIYTSFNFALGMPIVLYGIFDKDVTEHFSCDHPQIYSTGRDNVMLSAGAICLWMLNAMILSLVVYAMYFGLLYNSFLDYSVYELGTSAFIALIIGLTVKVCFVHNQWNVYNVLFIIISILGFYVWLLIVSTWYNSLFEDYYYVAQHTLSEPLTWLFSTFTIPIIFGLIDLIGQGYYLFFDPTEETLFREKSLQNALKLR